MMMLSSSTNQKYGYVQKHNEESDDDDDGHHDERYDLKNGENNATDGDDQDDDDGDGGNDNNVNKYFSQEKKLAAIIFADPKIVKATDENEVAATTTLEMMTHSNNHVYKDNEENKVVRIVTDKGETAAQQVMNDATELESLLFSVRRSSARFRLLRLISSLKQLSAKLERRDEVTNILNRIISSPTSTSGGTSATTDEPSVLQKVDTCMTNGQNSTQQASVDTVIPVTTILTKRSCPADIDENNIKNAKIQKTKDVSVDVVSLNTAATTSSSISITSQGHASNNANSATQVQAQSKTSTDPSIQPPLLKQSSEYVKLNLRHYGLQCPDFSLNNKCPLGSKCPRYHVFTPSKPNKRPMSKKFFSLRERNAASQTDLLAWYSKEDLEKAYKKYQNITLSSECFSEKIKPSGFNVPYYTCSFKCPVENTVYFAQPFPGDSFVHGNKSSQGIWWYLSMRDAREALATIVIRDLQSRNIVPDTFLPDLSSDEDIILLKKKASAKAAMMMTSSPIVVSTTNTSFQKKILLPSTLPDINPWNWAEYEYPKRCEKFNLPGGCPLGRNCPDAHVHIPKVVTTDSFPTKTALQVAYLQHYKVHVQDPFFQPNQQKNHNANLFHVKTLIDSQNQIWYTAAFICPIHKTLFYAAGGTSGRSNSQGFVLYPSVEEAKLAVSGVVLNSFLP